MLKLKTHSQYYEAYSAYQTFDSVADMIDTIKRFTAAYVLTDAVEAVLNTIKLHAKNYIGACWLKRREIARKAGVSLSSVDRAVSELKESGILTVHNKIHTKRGGKAPNVYVINCLSDESNKPSNDASLLVEIESSKPRVPTVTDRCERVHKNFNKALNNKDLKSIKIDKDLYVDDVLTTDSTSQSQKSDQLKSIPAEFIAIMEPFYANSPQIIADRYKTTCIAIKKTCGSIANTSWADVADAWKATVQRYKRSKINNATDDGLGGYFYATLLGQLPIVW